MEFYKLSNGDIVLESAVSRAFQITTGIPPYDAPDLYSKFLYGLSMSGRAEKYEPSVEELFSGGHTAYAYALYRDKTGCTLQEARQRVNFMMESIGY